MRVLRVFAGLSLLGVTVSLGLACTGEDVAIVTSSPDGGASDANVADSSTSSTDGGTGDANSDASVSPKAGDVVSLLPETIEADNDGHVTKWKNGVPGSTMTAITTTATKPSKVPATQGSAASCVAFSQTQLMLMNDDGTLNPGDGDFSVTTVLTTSQGLYPEFGQVPVARVLPTFEDGSDESDSFSAGWALFAWYQGVNRDHDNEPKFAARLKYELNLSAIEAVASVPHDQDKLYGVAMFRRGSQLFLAVDSFIEPAVNGAGNVAQPANRPLLLGKVDADGDYGSTSFNGKLCAVVVHHGSETDAEILARIQALRARF